MKQFDRKNGEEAFDRYVVVGIITRHPQGG